VFKDFKTQISYTFLDAGEKKNNIYVSSIYDISYFIRGCLEYTGFYQTSISSIIQLRQGLYTTQVIESSYSNILDVYVPIYSENLSNDRMKDYCRIDLSASRIFSIKDKFSIIGYMNISNILNRDNPRELNYNTDYSESFYEMFSKRSIYFGCGIQF
jgi:hypothetical protein